MRGSLADEQSICLKIQQKLAISQRAWLSCSSSSFRLKIPGETPVTMKRNTASNKRLSHFPSKLVAITIATSSLTDLFDFLGGQTEEGRSEGLELAKRPTSQLHPHID